MDEPVLLGIWASHGRTSHTRTNFSLRRRCVLAQRGRFEHKIRCKSGIFTLRLPAAASDQPCVGDFDGNGSVGLSDFSQFLVVFGTPCPGCPEDLDGDGTIGLGDFSAFLVVFGTDCP